MSKKTEEYKLTVVGGDRYPSLEAAQAAIFEPVARFVATFMEEKLASGELVVVEGKFVFDILKGTHLAEL